MAQIKQHRFNKSKQREIRQRPPPEPEATLMSNAKEAISRMRGAMGEDSIKPNQDDDNGWGDD